MEWLTESSGKAVSPLRMRMVFVGGVQEAMHVDDEVAHVGIVDGRRRGTAPRLVGLGIAWEDADDVQLVRIDELGRIRADQLTAENQMKQLTLRHGRAPVG